MLFNDNEIEPIGCKSRTYKTEELEYLTALLRDYESQNVIEKTELADDGFMNSVFLVEKSSSTVENRQFRLILNMKKINENYIIHEKFKMESLFSCLNLMSEGCFMASLDLKNAYHTIPIFEPHQKFLQFCVNGQTYRYKVLPQGYKDSPRIFTRILKPVIGHLRQKGFLSSIYIDDLYLQGDTFEECQKNVQVSKHLLCRLGFDISDKSSMIPSQKLVHLGFILNSVKMTVSLDDKKKNKIKMRGNELLKCKKTSVRILAKFIGIVVSCLPAVRYGALYYREMEIHKIQSLKSNCGDYDSQLILNDSCVEEIKWWVKEGINSFKPIYEGNHDMIVQSDSSDYAWGAFCKDIKTQGFWSEEESKMHINAKELLAASLGIKALCKDKKNCHIQIRIDNTTAVWYINKLGGTKSFECNKITKNLWLWCKERNIWLTAAFVEGVNNVEADDLSRKLNTECEISLNTEVFQSLCEQYGVPELDLFSSRINHKLNKYMTRYPEQGACGIDAFKYIWSGYIYIFPPFILINSILAKLKRDKPQKAMLIVPEWPTAVWYPKLMKMVKSVKKLGRADQISNIPRKEKRAVEFLKNLKLMICIC